jgi:hypothetical protein
MTERADQPQNNVRHLSHEEAELLISERFDGPIHPLDNRALLIHLMSCDSCRAFAVQMEVMARSFEDLPVLPPSPAVSRQVRDRIATLSPSPVSWLHWPRLNQAQAMTAAVAALVLVASMATLLLFISGQENGITPGTDETTRSTIDAPQNDILAQNVREEPADGEEPPVVVTDEGAPGPTPTVPNVTANETVVAAITAEAAPTETPRTVLPPADTRGQTSAESQAEETPLTLEAGEESVPVLTGTLTPESEQSDPQLAQAPEEDGDNSAAAFVVAEGEEADEPRDDVAIASIPEEPGEQDQPAGSEVTPASEVTATAEAEADSVQVIAASEPTETAQPEPSLTSPPPTPTEEPLPTEAPTETATLEPTQTPSPTNTPAPSETPSPTETATSTEAPTETATPSPTVATTETETATPSVTAEPTSTATPSPTQAPPSIAVVSQDEDDASVEEAEPIAQPTIAPAGGGAMSQETDEEQGASPAIVQAGGESEGTSGDLIPVEDAQGGDTGTAPGDTQETDEGESGSPPIQVVDGVGEQQADDEPATSPTISAVGGSASQDAEEEPEEPATKEVVAVEESAGEPSGLDNTTVVATMPAGTSAPQGRLEFRPALDLYIVLDSSGQTAVANRSGSIVATIGTTEHALWSPIGGLLLFGNGSVGTWDVETGDFYTIGEPAETSVVDTPAGWQDTRVYYLRTILDSPGLMELRSANWDGSDDAFVWSGEGYQLSGDRPLAVAGGFLIPTDQGWLFVSTGGGETLYGSVGGYVQDAILSPGGSLFAYQLGNQVIIALVDQPDVPYGTMPYVDGPGAGFSFATTGQQVAISDGQRIDLFSIEGNELGSAGSGTGMPIAGTFWIEDTIYFVQSGDNASLRSVSASAVQSGQLET